MWAHSPASPDRYVPLSAYSGSPDMPYAAGALLRTALLCGFPRSTTESQPGLAKPCPRLASLCYALHYIFRQNPPVRNNLVFMFSFLFRGPSGPARKENAMATAPKKNFDFLADGLRRHFERPDRLSKIINMIDKGLDSSSELVQWKYLTLIGDRCFGRVRSYDPGVVAAERRGDNAGVRLEIVGAKKEKPAVPAPAKDAPVKNVPSVSGAPSGPAVPFEISVLPVHSANSEDRT